MPIVNMHDAKTHLAELVRRVLRGEVVIIARAGRPMAQLIPLSGLARPRRVGSPPRVVDMDEAEEIPAAPTFPHLPPGKPRPRAPFVAALKAQARARGTRFNTH